MSEYTASETSGQGAMGVRQQDDWWAVAVGLGLIAVAYGLFASGHSLGWLAVTPPKWTSLGPLLAHFAGAWPRYLAQGGVWLAIVTAALRALGYPARHTAPAFLLVYIISIVIFTLGQWAVAVRFNLEPPLLALAVGLFIGNVQLLPRAFDAGFRVEFYIKLGVVLLGATLPLTLIAWAGPIAFAQASIASVVTFLVIFAVARLLGLEQRFAAVLGVGGAVCGVSAAIAIAAAVGARRQDVAAVISIVILWAIAMIFVLPFAAHLLALPAGVGGAWIGTSEFADAAGLAAAQAYGAMAAKAASTQTNSVEQAIAAFTLMKVVGRDIWIGVWALVLSVIAAARWQPTGIESRVGIGDIWRRFPKFVIGFLLASVFITLIAQQVGHAQFSHTVTTDLVTPLKTMRSWAFAFGFLSIGLTTRMRTLASVGTRPLLAFSAGVAVNVVLGLVLSTYVFGSYWTGLGK